MLKQGNIAPETMYTIPAISPPIWTGTIWVQLLLHRPTCWEPAEVSEEILPACWRNTTGLLDERWSVTARSNKARGCWVSRLDYDHHPPFSLSLPLRRFRHLTQRFIPYDQVQIRDASDYCLTIVIPLTVGWSIRAWMPGQCCVTTLKHVIKDPLPNSERG